MGYEVNQLYILLLRQIKVHDQANFSAVIASL